MSGLGSDPVVIDLGEVAARFTPSEPDPGPAWLPAHRRALGALVSVVLIAVAAPVSAPPPSPAVTIPTEPSDITLYGRNTYYAFGLGNGPGDRSVTAYRLPDGRRLWRAALPAGRVGWLTVPETGAADLARPAGLAGAHSSAQGGALVLSHEGPSPPGSAGSGGAPPRRLDRTPHPGRSSTVGRPAYGEPAAVLAGTGRVIYRTGGQMIGLLPGGGVLPYMSPGGEFVAEAGGRRIVARSPDTGAALWTYTAPAGAWLAWDPRDGGLDAVAVLLPSGRLELRDLPRGVRTAAADVLPRRPPADQPAGVQLVGDLVLVEEVRAGKVWATAYGRRRLDRRWSVRMDLAAEYAATCGDLLCVGGLGRGVRVLDAATGATLWSSRRWSFVEPVGEHLIAGPADARPNGTGLVVLDADTGRVRADLGGWTPVWPVPADGQPIAVRHDLRHGRSWFGRIDTRRGRVWVVGTVTDVTDDCRAGADHVACRRPDGTTGVWRLPRA